jgi:hypothetical protein
MTNARCLTEGVDVPAIDCVVFADPKQSRIDIVQAAGRALRRYPGKDYGYILLPLIVPREMGFNEFAETTGFRRVALIVTGLSIQDERIADEFRAIQQGRIPTGKIVEISGDVLVGMHMSLDRFAEAISTRIWESVGRANWRKFEDARTFVRGLGLKSADEWRDYCKSGRKPADIPATPYNMYRKKGWVSFGDWLGSDSIATYSRQYRSFTRARAFVRGLGLKSWDQWIQYCNSGNKPEDIPNAPNQVYAYDWSSMGDWLGTGNRHGDWRPFKKARAFVRRLGLKSRAEWTAYCKSGKRPTDVPRTPSAVYADEGWSGMGDWLGTGKIANQEIKYRSFRRARYFARGLGLKSRAEWTAYCKSGKRPADIPNAPDQAYREAGWSSWGDWLGTSSVATYLRKYRPFKEARAFVRRLGLKSGDEWSQYCKSGKKPDNIPNAPHAVYADEGWSSMGDWLGTGNVANYLRQYRSFTKARAFVRDLGVKTYTEWRDYCRSGEKPEDIPSNPNLTYAESGWSGYSNWLGTDVRQ